MSGANSRQGLARSVGRALAAVLALFAVTLAGGPRAHAADISLQGQRISSWAIQLQNDDASAIAAVPYDVVVVDYSRDGSQGGAFTAGEVAAMKVKPDGSRRFVIAYVSIGEAENYRFYWQKSWSNAKERPGWIVRQNSEWAGNYSVKFWDKGWQGLILDNADSYINRVLVAGFDGVYLDKIDVTDDVEDYAPAGATALDLMVQLVGRISTTTKAANPNFLIIASNAEPLLDNDTYRGSIDGIGKEDILFHEQEAPPGSRTYRDGFASDPDQVAGTKKLLSLLTDDSKLVLVVEYLEEQAQIDAAAAAYAELGYIAYFGPRSLARLAPPEVIASITGPP